MINHETDIFTDVLDELERARKKFPNQDVWRMLSALTEEIGEVNKAILQFHDQPEYGVTKNDIRKEIIQSISMLCRVALDCGLEL